MSDFFKTGIDGTLTTVYTDTINETFGGGIVKTEAERRASKKYDMANTTKLVMKLNLKTDADILGRLSEVESKQGYIKQLIRKDIGSTT